MKRTISVFCASSDFVPPLFREEATKLGETLASRGYTLLYGGEDIGLMGALARAVNGRKGRVAGVITEFAKEREKVNLSLLDEFVVVRDFRERKAYLESRADAFLVLPGGYGTLDEVSEILNLKQLGGHTKPVILINTSGYFGPLQQFFQNLHDNGFSSKSQQELCSFASSSIEAIRMLEQFWEGQAEAIGFA